jgi:hypothetical protein
MPDAEVAIYSPDHTTVTVALHGTYGRGKLVKVDAEDWERVDAAYGSVWSINFNGARTGFQVCRAHRAVADAARQRGAKPKANLARLVAGAKGREQVVWYRDRDPLNLRRSNLEVISRAEHLARLRSPASE